jgi:hypothetical protein
VSSDAFPALFERSKTLKKKKKKSSGSPKKAARRATTGAMKKVKKGPASKPKKTKPSARKKGTKAPSSAAKKGKLTAGCDSQPICVENFPASNNDCVCFTGIPTGGCTLSQISGEIYPFSPVTGTSSGLDYTDLTQSNNCVTVVVPAINKTYPYNVSCCTGPADPAHSVTVDS